MGSLVVLALIAVSPVESALLGKLFGRSRASSLSTFNGKFAPEECMGTWHVQRQIPAVPFLEAGGRNGIEQYDYEEGADHFSVRYTFNRKGDADDELTTIRQRGWLSDKWDQWEVAPWLGKFFLPFRLPFIIIDADPSSHMICTGGLKSWMYVMTRDRQPSSALIDSCMAKVEAAGFDMSKVLVVDHV